jgi:hypothetical protein
MVRHPLPGNTIGMINIKQHRLTKLTLASYPDLHVGEYVLFAFLPKFDHALSDPLKND